MIRKNAGSALTGNALLELVIRTISSIMVTVPLTLLNDRASAHITPENISVDNYLITKNRTGRLYRMLRQNTLFRYISAFRSKVRKLKTTHWLKHLRRKCKLNRCVPLGVLVCGPPSILNVVVGLVTCLVTTVL